jgi:hypothetical protein
MLPALCWDPVAYRDADTPLLMEDTGMNGTCKGSRAWDRQYLPRELHTTMESQTTSRRLCGSQSVPFQRSGVSRASRLHMAPQTKEHF